MRVIRNFTLALQGLPQSFALYPSGIPPDVMNVGLDSLWRLRHRTVYSSERYDAGVAKYTKATPNPYS